MTTTSMSMERERTFVDDDRKSAESGQIQAYELRRSLVERKRDTQSVHEATCRRYQADVGADRADRIVVGERALHTAPRPRDNQEAQTTRTVINGGDSQDQVYITSPRPFSSINHHTLLSSLCYRLYRISYHVQRIP